MDMVQRRLQVKLYEMPDGSLIESISKEKAIQIWESLQKQK